MRYIPVLVILAFSAVRLAAEPIQWVFTDYAPANYVDDDGEYAGFLYEITMEALANRMGIPVDVEVYPWSRCQHMVEIGQRDMFLTIPTRDRLEYAIPTDEPVWIKRRFIYTYGSRKDLEKINGLYGLEQIRQAGYTVISYRGNNWITENVEAADIPVEYANSVDGMYRMLAAGRGDLVIEERSIARYNITQLGLDEKLVETEGVAEESGFHLFIGKESPFIGLMDELNRVVHEMWEDGTIQKVLDKYGA